MKNQHGFVDTRTDDIIGIGIGCIGWVLWRYWENAEVEANRNIVDL